MAVGILVYQWGNNGSKGGEHGVHEGLEARGQGCVSGGGDGSRDGSRGVPDQGLPMQPTDRHHQRHQPGD